VNRFTEHDTISLTEMEARLDKIARLSQSELALVRREIKRRKRVIRQQLEKRSNT
jgi:hypothetical protein